MLGTRQKAFLGLVVFACFVVAATVSYSPATSHTSGSVLKALSQKWQADYASATEVAKCRDFNTLQDALTYFGSEYFSHLEPCRHYQSDRRVIAFYDVGNIHGFLTCYAFSKSDYFCCAQIAKGYTKDYNTWKARCS